MSTPASPEGSEPNQAPHSPGQFPEITPGVPRYGQYAPPGYQAPGMPTEQPGETGTKSSGTKPSGNGPVLPTWLGNQPPGTAGQPGSVPLQINRAFVLILAAGAIMLVTAVTSFFAFNSPEIRAALLKQLNEYPEFATAGLDISSVITASMVTAAVMGVVAVGLYVLIAFKIRAGRSWARVLGTVLAVLSLVLLVSLSPLSLLQVGFGAFGIIYCWLPANRAYFKR
ncbi:hypothetical protein FHU41_001795 [Psychromicrobium silvestre]|uniref:DUF4064 domain-containing protein n=1 Tax=Psychromicrobium silvestre TaxID=1645614 RepID=A0A7Y9LTX6_9MICC|nr:hypothetical protein [Psychromicrobium silvestre]NYE95545.1 hypothetical protein [Psychromicrobium silvestre]